MHTKSGNPYVCRDSICVYVYMCVCIYVYICIYIYACVCVCVYLIERLSEMLSGAAVLIFESSVYRRKLNTCFWCEGDSVRKNEGMRI